MHNLTKVASVRSYNPVGVIATPFDPAGFIGPSGTEASPASEQSYIVRGGDLMIHTYHSGVVVTIRDAEGEIFITTSALAQPMMVPVGFSITFGKFTAAPQIIVAGS